MSEPLVRDQMEILMRRAAEARELAETSEREHRRDMEAVLREVMEVGDGVERLRRGAPDAQSTALGAVVAQIQELLAAHGLVAFRPAVGSQIDGRTSEVMATVDEPGLRAGMVTAVVRSGYRSGERVVRRAGVEAVKEQR